MVKATATSKLSGELPTSRFTYRPGDRRHHRCVKGGLFQRGDRGHQLITRRVCWNHPRSSGKPWRMSGIARQAAWALGWRVCSPSLSARVKHGTPRVRGGPLAMPRPVHGVTRSGSSYPVHGTLVPAIISAVRARARA
jgi:hypothetical protein